MNLNFAIIKTFDALREMKESWRSLYASLPENTIAFSSWEYIYAFVLFYRPANWMVICAYKDESFNELVGVFPLEIYQGELEDGIIKVCRPLGSIFAYYSDFLTAADIRAEVINAAIPILRDSFGCEALYYGYIHEESKNYLLLIESIAPRAEEYKLIRQKVSPYIDARTLDFETFFASKKKSTLPDARRCRRRLAEQGGLDILNVADTDGMGQEIKELLRIHGNKFAGRHIYDNIDSRWGQFFAELIDAEAGKGIVELVIMRLNGEIIAGSLNFLCKGRRYYYMPFSVKKYDKFSPSKVLMAHLIEKTFEENGVFCFGPGVFPYKEDWCQAIAELKVLWLFLTPRARELLPQRAGLNINSLFDRE